ncbi:MAG: acetylglutamate kinase [Pseudobdellovibrionaceae bacterium]
MEPLSPLITYKEKFKNSTIVIKFGGALANDDTVIRIARQIDFLRTAIRAHVIVVHGGGLQIDKDLTAAGIPILRDERTGLRITDEQTLEATDKALRALNGRIVRLFNTAAAVDHCAIGLSGYDLKLIEATPSGSPQSFTGHVTSVNCAALRKIIDIDPNVTVPIIYPICFNANARGNEHRLNVNADDVAAHIAKECGASRLMLCSDIDGVLDKNGKLIPELTADEAYKLISDGTVAGGMIPKLSMAAKAAEAMQRGGVAIINGRSPDSILKEMLTPEGSGTLIRYPEDITLKP